MHCWRQFKVEESPVPRWMSYQSSHHHLIILFCTMTDSSSRLTLPGARKNPMQPFGNGRQGILLTPYVVKNLHMQSTRYNSYARRLTSYKLTNRATRIATYNTPMVASSPANMRAHIFEGKISP